jgi:hypothetical protein
MINWTSKYSRDIVAVHYCGFLDVDVKFAEENSHPAALCDTHLCLREVDIVHTFEFFE